MDQGAFPGKPVVEPILYESLTEEEKRLVMEAVNLIKEERDGTVKGQMCADGSKQKKYMKLDQSIASPTASISSSISGAVGIPGTPDTHPIIDNLWLILD